LIQPVEIHSNIFPDIGLLLGCQKYRLTRSFISIVFSLSHLALLKAELTGYHPIAVNSSLFNDQ